MFPFFCRKSEKMCGDKCAHLNKVIKKNASANLKNIVFKVISVIRHV